MFGVKKKKEKVVSIEKTHIAHCFSYESSIIFYRMLKQDLGWSFTWVYCKITSILTVQPLSLLMVLRKLTSSSKYATCPLWTCHDGMLFVHCCQFTACTQYITYGFLIYWKKKHWFRGASEGFMWCRGSFQL